MVRNVNEPVGKPTDSAQANANAPGEGEPIDLPRGSVRVMVVDDEPTNIKVACRYLETAGYTQFITTSESPKALDLIRDQRPDVVLLDVMMPQVDGLAILEAVRADPALRYLPVIILTASNEARTKQRALELGATDFLHKPVDPSELLPRVHNVLMFKAYQDHLKRYAEELEEAVRLRTAEVEASRQDLIFCLARAAEFRDDDTGHHILRVGRYAGMIAAQLGFNNKFVKLIEQAAQLHDVGKIGIPDSILLKPSTLDPEEFETIKKHCGFGKRIILPLPDTEWTRLKTHTNIGSRIMDVASSPVLIMAARIAVTHHEKWNGTGYPLGLAGEDIPIEGRIVAVADVYDALSSARPYKPPFPREQCVSIMQDQRGIHFDPGVLDAFVARIEDVVQIQIEYADLA
jgi:putative two-component system response regulator